MILSHFYAVFNGHQVKKGGSHSKELKGRYKCYNGEGVFQQMKTTKPGSRHTRSVESSMSASIYLCKGLRKRRQSFDLPFTHFIDLHIASYSTVFHATSYSLFHHFHQSSHAEVELIYGVWSETSDQIVK